MTNELLHLALSGGFTLLGGLALLGVKRLLAHRDALGQEVEGIKEIVRTLELRIVRLETRDSDRSGE